MKIGSLDRRITIQYKVATQDPNYGTEIVTWATLATVWANIQDVMPSRHTSENVVGGGLEKSRNPTRIRIRWRDDVDSSMRITTTYPRARTLQIIGGPADIGGRRNYMELMAEEIR